MILGLLSDAHGHVEAFHLAVALLRHEGAERLYFLGDAVGYLPGGAVVEALMQLDILPILGNHEAILLSGEISSDRDAIYRLNETRRAMSCDAMNYLRQWPTSREIFAECGRLLMVHGGPTDPTFGYVYPDSDLSGFDVESGATVFMGNTHRPFIREHNGARFINVGSCGLPRDEGNLGSVCLFDSMTGKATILRFDIVNATRAALRRCTTVHRSVVDVFARRSARSRSKGIVRG